MIYLEQVPPVDAAVDVVVTGISIVNVQLSDAVLSFPAASVATPAATLTITVPSEEPFITSNV